MMTFEEKRVIRNQISDLVENVVDRIANDQPLLSSKKVVLDTIIANARVLATNIIAGFSIPAEDQREFRDYAEFEIAYNAREHIINMPLGFNLDV